MRAIGTEMHRAASRFAVVATEGDPNQALAGLAKMTEQCVACHDAYRVH
jgi:cytochrome c556